jgi:hypothetical protein
MTYPNPPEQPAYPSAAGYGPPAAPTRLRGRTPRRLGWIFLALAVVAFVIGGVVLATKSVGKVNSFHRITFASGSGTVHLDGTGKWVGYYEAHNVSNSISVIPGFQAVVTGPTGQPVTLEPYGNRSDGKVKKLTYDYNSHHGVAAFQFTASQAGTYHIQLQAVSSLPADADVAIGRDIEGGTVVGALLIVLGVLLLIAAIVLLIVGYVKRGRHKRELQAAAYYGGPPPGAWPAGPTPGQPGQWGAQQPGQWPATPQPGQWQPGPQQPGPQPGGFQQPGQQPGGFQQPGEQQPGGAQQPGQWPAAPPEGGQWGPPPSSPAPGGPWPTPPS